MQLRSSVSAVHKPEQRRGSCTGSTSLLPARSGPPPIAIRFSSLRSFTSIRSAILFTRALARATATGRRSDVRPPFRRALLLRRRRCAASGLAVGASFTRGCARGAANLAAIRKVRGNLTAANVALVATRTGRERRAIICVVLWEKKWFRSIILGPVLAVESFLEETQYTRVS